MRRRTLIKDFDITINCIQEQFRAGETGVYRQGFNVKGDLGPFEVYSTLDYYSEEDAYSPLAGFDYSYFFQVGNQLCLQAEYLNTSPKISSRLIGSMPFASDKERSINPLAGNINYEIDEFSSICLTILYNNNTNSVIFMSVYGNQLSTSSTTIKIRGGL